MGRGPRIAFWSSTILFGLTVVFFFLGPRRATSFYPEFAFEGVYWLLIYMPEITLCLFIALLVVTFFSLFTFARNVAELAAVCVVSCALSYAIFWIIGPDIEYEIAEDLGTAMSWIGCVSPFIVYVLWVFLKSSDPTRKLGAVTVVFNLLVALMIALSFLGSLGLDELYEGMDAPTYGADHQNWLHHHHRSLDESGAEFVASRIRHVSFGGPSEAYSITYYYFDCDRFGLWCKYTGSSFERFDSEDSE